MIGDETHSKKAVSTDQSDPYLSGPQVDKYLSITHQTRWRWIRAGKLRDGVSVTPKSKRWRKSWIDEDMESLREGV